MKGGKMMFKKSEILSYVFFILGVVALGVYFAGIIPESTMLIVLGLLGFSGVATLRGFIDSSGYKTYIIIVFAVLGIVLEQFGVLTPDWLAKWLAFWGVLSGASMTHAVKKAQG